MHLGLGKFFFPFLSVVALLVIVDVRADESDIQARDIVIEDNPYQDQAVELQEGQNAVDLLIPYRDRRGTWGATVGINYSMYNPTNYQPDSFVNSNFDDIYDTTELPFLSLVLSIKWNSGIGAISLDLGGGYYENTGESESSLSMTPFMVGGTWALDNLFSEPVVAPYVGGGYSQVFYKEETGGSIVGGSEPHFYYAAGVLIQLDWMDKDGDFYSYTESGVENTYINIGVIGLTGSPREDADFTGDPALIAGIKVEI